MRCGARNGLIARSAPRLGMGIIVCRECPHTGAQLLTAWVKTMRWATSVWSISGRTVVNKPLIPAIRLTAVQVGTFAAHSEAAVINGGLDPPMMTVGQGRVAARVPTQLLSGCTRVLRPVDAVRVYAHPRPEFARLERSGALRRVAPGYYAVVPDDRVGLAWLPELEAVGLGVGVAVAGVDGVALMGLSAARVHGGLPRVVGVTERPRVFRTAD
jgi:hypothetical protein